jgi:hypothetical protein
MEEAGARPARRVEDQNLGILNADPWIRQANFASTQAGGTG